MPSQRPDQLLREFQNDINPRPCSEAEQEKNWRAVDRALTLLNHAKNAFVSYAKAQANWENNDDVYRVSCKQCDRDGTNETGAAFYVYLLDPTLRHDLPTGYNPNTADSGFDPGGHPNVNQHAVIGYRQGLSADGTKDVMVAVTAYPDAPIGTMFWFLGDDYRDYKPGWALMDGEENHGDNGGSGYDMMNWVANGNKYLFDGTGGNYPDGLFAKAGAPDGLTYGDPNHKHTQDTEHPHTHKINNRITGGGHDIEDGGGGDVVSVGRVDAGDCLTGAKVIVDGPPSTCEADHDMDHLDTGYAEGEPEHMYFWPMERINNSVEGLVNQATSDETYTPGASGGDAYWSSSAGPTDDTTLTAGHYTATGSWHFFVRFPNVQIPQGAIINQAYLRLQAHETQSGTINLKVHAVDEDDVVLTDLDTYAECEAADVTAGIDWDVTEWTADTDYLSPLITAAIQTVVNRENWASGNAIVLMVKDDSSATNQHVVAKSSNADNTLQRLEVAWHEST